MLASRTLDGNPSGENQQARRRKKRKLPEPIELSSDESDASEIFASGNRIWERYGKETANEESIQGRIAQHLRVMESEEDSLSTGSDFGVLWGHNRNGNNNHHQVNGDESNNSRNSGMSSGEIINIHSSDDDSSVQILSNPPSPIAGMNGRKQSNRQRRLEAARSKNNNKNNNNNEIVIYSDSSEDDFPQTVSQANDNDNDNFSETISNANNPTIGAEVSKESRRSKTASKSSALIRNNSNGTKSSARGKRKMTAVKSITKQPKESTTNSRIFANLFCNGKDFFAWANITDPYDFLKYHKAYANKVNLWRKERNLPLFTDTNEYISTLRTQIKENLKEMKASTSKAKTKIAKKPKTNDNTIYPLLKDLPLDGGAFFKHMKISDVEEVFSTRGLHNHVNAWRQSQNLGPIDEKKCLQTWRQWIRKNVKDQAKPRKEQDDVDEDKDETPDEIDFSNCMEVVPELSKRFLNKLTGLPVYQFAVYDTFSKDVIYEFKVEAKPSWIPNAGNGAFLTFLGAREAFSEEEDSPPEVETIQPLVARDVEGYHMNLRIVGEHLLETHNDNKRAQYPAPTSLPPIHGIPETFEMDADPVSNTYPWKLQPEGEELLSKYTKNSDILFSTTQIGCSVIELGRYGPFLRSDRKFMMHYDLKNFIFSNEVSEWGFEIVEDLNGIDQVADVTDDTTGMPHAVTEQNVPMYVNETGGDPTLKQTVWSGQVHDREVNYYFQTETPMKKGETIELLISYFKTYDEIRERKGYGETYKRGKVRSDDHYATFLDRNFVERYDMVEVIFEVEEPVDLYLLSEFLEKIRSNLAEIVDTFVRELQTSSEGINIPFAQQMIALRRLNWLKPFFQKKIESFEKRVSSSAKTADSVFEIAMLRHCAANANDLEWPSWPILMDLLEKHPNLVDGKGINVRSKFREEVTEDICYGVSSSFICPCNEAVWCDVASRLTRELCYMIARNHWDYSKPESSSKLAEAMVQKTINAADEILNPTTIEVFKFDVDVWERYALNNRGSISKEPRGAKCFMGLANDCKGPEKRLPAPYILRGKLPVDQTNLLKTIHKPWYLVRQILFVTDTFAKRYLAADTTYNFNNLREKLGVTPEASSMFFSKGDIELDLHSKLFFGEDFESTYSRGNKLNDPKERKERSSRSKSASETREEKETKKQKKKKHRILRTPVRKLLFWDIVMKRLQEELGWNIEYGNRAHDWYLLPPGVRRGTGCKPRIDFFDSAPLVINCLKTDKRYCNLPEIKLVMEEYGKCQFEFESMKSSKNKELKTLSNKEIVEKLRKKVKPLLNGSTVAADNSQRRAVTTVKALFRSERLGLLLAGEGGQVIVKGVQNEDFLRQIIVGDAIIAIGDSCTREKSLEDTCDLIRMAGRPVTICFERKLQLPLDPSA